MLRFSVRRTWCCGRVRGTRQADLHRKPQQAICQRDAGGGKISHPITEVEVRALPGALPQFLVVDLSNIQGGQTVHLSDIVVPEGVELVELARGHNLGVAVASGSAAE